jgi:hypothetical protein
MKSLFILILSCSLFSLTGCAEPPDPANGSQADTQDFLSNMEALRSEAQRRCQEGNRSACIDVHSIETDEPAAQRDQSARPWPPLTQTSLPTNRGLASILFT